MAALAKNRTEVAPRGDGISGGAAKINAGLELTQEEKAEKKTN